jgi:hypothetical protein
VAGVDGSGGLSELALFFILLSVMSSSVLRRYTPPTCTLEVAAIGSALSRWTDRAVLKNLRFELSFDDPTQNSDQQVTIRGDRNQLEALWDAVSNYVQSLLMQSGESVRLEPGDRLGNGVEAPDSISPLHDAGIKLQPKGRLSHELHLGNLANAESAVIPLTTLQLFDLANALDEYHSEALTLPSLGRPRWIKAVPNSWVKSAAAAVLVLGVSVPVVKFVTDLSSPQVASTTVLTKDVEISTAQRAGDLPTPSAPGRTPPPLTMTPLNPSVPPPPVGTTVFPAPVPGVATVPDTPPVSVPIAPSQPTTIEIPTEPVIPEIPDNPPIAAAPAPSSEAPPRLEGTDLDDLAASTAPANADTLNDELAAAGLSASGAAPNASSSAAASARSAPPANASSNQAEEVKSYFQQNWQPPEGLTDTLEYRLLLNADGSLQRILPLGNASANFLDRTNMPLLGESFVSPTVDGKKPQIRVVLEPDGRVQTFLEYAD